MRVAYSRYDNMTQEEKEHFIESYGSVSENLNTEALFINAILDESYNFITKQYSFSDYRREHNVKFKDHFDEKWLLNKRTDYNNKISVKDYDTLGIRFTVKSLFNEFWKNLVKHANRDTQEEGLYVAPLEQKQRADDIYLEHLIPFKCYSLRSFKIVGGINVIVHKTETEYSIEFLYSIYDNE